MRRILLKALMGLFVTLLFFSALELALRALLGPATPPAMARQMYRTDVPPFTVANGMVTPDFQSQDAIPAFPVEPTPGLPRVMVFGESSVRAGSHLPIALEFPDVLGRMLGLQGQKVEMLNLGRPATDSNSLKWIVPAALQFKPDLVIFYNGHNDIGNAYMMQRFGTVRSALVGRMQLFFNGLQTYAQLRGLVQRSNAAEIWIPAGGNEHGIAAMTEGQRLVAEGNFDQNMRWILHQVQEAKVPVVLSTVISEIDSWTSGKPVCSDALPQGTWSHNDPVRYDLNPNKVTMADVEAALEQAPDCPEAVFLRGYLLRRSGRFEEGMAELYRARELDAVPMRATKGINDAIRELGKENGVPVVDIEAAISTLPDTSDLFNDRVHLSVYGHGLVARQLAPVVSEEIKKITGTGG